MTLWTVRSIRSSLHICPRNRAICRTAAPIWTDKPKGIDPLRSIPFFYAVFIPRCTFVQCSGRANLIHHPALYRAVPFAATRKEPKGRIRAAALMYPASLALHLGAASIFRQKNRRIGLIPRTGAEFRLIPCLRYSRFDVLGKQIPPQAFPVSSLIHTKGVTSLVQSTTSLRVSTPHSHLWCDLIGAKHHLIARQRRTTGSGKRPPSHSHAAIMPDQTAAHSQSPAPSSIPPDHASAMQMRIIS